MPKEDLTLIRVLKRGDRGKDVVAIKGMTSRAGVGFTPVKEKGKTSEFFGDKLDAGVRSFQKMNKLVKDGEVGYMTFKALLPRGQPWRGPIFGTHSAPGWRRDLDRERGELPHLADSRAG